MMARQLSDNEWRYRYLRPWTRSLTWGIGLLLVGAFGSWLASAVILLLVTAASYVSAKEIRLRKMALFLPVGDWCPELWWQSCTIEPEDRRLARRILRSRWRIQQDLFRDFPAFCIRSLESNSLGIMAALRPVVPVTSDGIAKTVSQLANAWKVSEVRVEALEPREITLIAVTRDPLEGTRQMGEPCVTS